MLQEELFANLQCQPGFACNKDDVSADLRSFMNWNIFQDVQARVSDRSKDGKVRQPLSVPPTHRSCCQYIPFDLATHGCKQSKSSRRQCLCSAGEILQDGCGYLLWIKFTEFAACSRA